MKTLLLSGLILLTTTALAATNAVPIAYQPLVPMTAKPGSGQFTLTVNGTGFASTAVVTWNGSTRVTSFISSSQVQAIINAGDVASAGTAWVNVVNPTPGGGPSNTVFFPIQTPSSTVVFSPAPDFSGSGVSIEGDFNNDGVPDLAVYEENDGAFFIDTYLGNGNGTFQSPSPNPSVVPIDSMITGNFTGSTKLGIAVSDGLGNTLIFPNHGDGLFIPKQTFRAGTGGIGGAVTADFNRDGKLDLVVSGYYPKIFLGNGDGTFGNPGELQTGCGYSGYTTCGFPATGDFNGDGNLDFASADGYGVNVWLGNGDGTFQKSAYYLTTYGGFSVTVADVNGDGKLDIITNGLSVLLGNGDGTFSVAGGVQINPNSSYNPVAPVVGDFNGDGKLDVALTSAKAIWLLLGNGNGTFQAPIQAAGDSPTTLVTADFNDDGKLDMVGHALYLQIPLLLSPVSINFGNQQVGIGSPPQTVTALNIGGATLPITSVNFSGADPQDFGQANNCGSGLPTGKSCQIQVTFTPQVAGQRSATLNVNYRGVGSPQTVSLTGFGAELTVTVTPAKLTFKTQVTGTTSPAQASTVTNTGTGSVSVSKISTSGPFTQSNNCPASLPVNGSCQIQVEFAPVSKGLATGNLSVTDNAQGSPQTVGLSGEGTIVELSPVAINFGNQQVGTHSDPAPVEFTNVGTIAVKISKIAFGGDDPGDFSQTNNCGTSVPAGGKCTFQVTFTPNAKGKRSASLQVSDNGGGSPQKVALSGKGT
ncbi:MAG TPA: choice-of-anchor D domain-containing protein [Terriglobales bacterium]